MANFVHLHVHSQYSILDGACKVTDLVTKAKEYGMPAVALTDHGNMFGVLDFFFAAKKAGIKPIIGVEAYIAEKSMDDKIRNNYHLILLAKNLTGYHNLMKLVTEAHLYGLYYKPRMDKKLLKQYSEGIIASSACLGGEIPQKILKGDIEGAKQSLREYLDIFGEDFYLELMRHKTGDPEKDKDTFQKQEYVNKYLIEFAKEFNVKLIATNDVHFLNKEDFEAHRILICINTGKSCDDQTTLQYTGAEFFASPDYMAELFADMPEVLENTLEIAEKVEEYDITSDPIMPVFKIPEGFKDDAEYLRHLVYEGAKKRWPELTDEIKERLEFELNTIIQMGFPSYFLIVQDFIKEAREMGVWVGPGRGSAAGSAVAYALEIIDVDPIKYDLLFERFLNPDRISMPDIDVDFDEDGRDLILKRVAEKYGRKRVAHIITFGTLAPKMSIRDVARVLGYPLEEADRLAKMIPEKAKNFKDAFEKSEELRYLRDNGSPMQQKILQLAEKVEGSVRHTGIHACGVIIGRDDLDKFIPLTQPKGEDSVLFAATQYDGSFVEKVGMLKMDFLGLKTLSILKDTLENIKMSRGIEIKLKDIPLDDKETYELFSRGDTIGLFQFESAGMRKYLRQLKPNRLEDLIAMNALYRPGPMDYIPQFIARKHGREPITYDLPQMKEILEETYGVTVYQEQVMLLSRKLAGFTRGEADTLRKAMGKKIKHLLEQLKPKFISGCQKNNIPIEKAEKIWADWEKFASYAFNKSHSTCYAYLAYQTGYLKAHYPAEFMAALLSRNYKELKKLSEFMDEARRIGLTILGPDVNESWDRFVVNKDGAIRFGLAAIKGVGVHAAEVIVKEREQNGPYKDIYDFVERVDLKVINKRVMESLVYAGALDNISPYPRAQFFEGGSNGTFLEELLRYGANYQRLMSNAANSLFNGTKIDTNRPQPAKIIEEWNKMEKLDKEKSVIGIYLSSHPLDDDKPVILAYRTHQLKDLKKDLSAYENQDIRVIGIVINASRLVSKSGNPYGKVILEDYSDTYEFVLFGDTFTKFFNLFATGVKLMIHGRVMKKTKNNNVSWDFRILDVKLLSEMKLSKIIVKVDMDDLADPVWDKVKEFLVPPNGEGIRCEFYVNDPASKVAVTLKAKDRVVEKVKDFIDFLEENGKLYKLFPANGKNH